MTDTDNTDDYRERLQSKYKAETGKELPDHIFENREIIFPSTVELNSEMERQIEKGREIGYNEAKAEQEPTRGGLLLLLLLGALSGFAVGVGIGMVIGAMVL